MLSNWPEIWGCALRRCVKLNPDQAHQLTLIELMAITEATRRILDGLLRQMN